MLITKRQCQGITPHCLLQQEASQGREKLQNLRQENASNCGLFNKVENIPEKSLAPNRGLYRQLKPHVLHNHESFELVTGQVVKEIWRLQL